MVQHVDIVLPPFGRGFHLIDDMLKEQLPELPANGLLHLFINHTSAGLMINENADPSVRRDFETVFNKLVPEKMKEITHTLEGPDDMPAHVKSTLAGHSVTLPIRNGRISMGTWQGIYLCEFRNRASRRLITATIIS
jgi:secondary thiamine-phosphate synthase enzyme